MGCSDIWGTTVLEKEKMKSNIERSRIVSQTEYRLRFVYEYLTYLVTRDLLL